MNRRDIAKGMTVYHALFAHWGRGVVVDFRTKDNLGFVTAHKVRVRWHGSGPQGEVWARCAELRKTPREGK